LENGRKSKKATRNALEYQRTERSPGGGRGKRETLGIMYSLYKKKAGTIRVVQKQWKGGYVKKKRGRPVAKKLPPTYLEEGVLFC